MTELEQRLANALEQLGKQYTADVRSLSLQVDALSSRLDAQTQQLQRLQQLQQQQTTEREKADKTLREALSLMLEQHTSEALDREKSLKEGLVKALKTLSERLNELAES